MQRRNRNNSLCLFILKLTYQYYEKKVDESWEILIKISNEFKNCNDTSSQAKNKYLKEKIRQIEEKERNNNQIPKNNENNENVPANNKTNEIIINNQPINNNIIINEKDSINERDEKENSEQINNSQINSKI